MDRPIWPGQGTRGKLAYGRTGRGVNGTRIFSGERISFLLLSLIIHIPSITLLSPRDLFIFYLFIGPPILRTLFAMAFYRCKIASLSFVSQHGRHFFFILYLVTIQLSTSMFHFILCAWTRILFSSFFFLHAFHY